MSATRNLFFALAPDPALRRALAQHAARLHAEWGGASAGLAAVEVRDTRASPALPDFLPAEARDTIALIERGGPFPHPQDGSVFGNREGRLPAQPRGYYREYTVHTPGLDHRGARRIVTGGQPPATWYYTDDHYDSFRAFTVGAINAGTAQ